MDEREQLLALAKNCTPLLTELAQTENEYIDLCGKTAKFKNNLGWVVLGFLCGPLMLLSILALVNQSKRDSRKPQLEQELDRIHNDPLLSWLPPDYRNSFSAGKIIEYLTNMRAKTLQEALNLLETELHQARLEQEVANIKIVNNHYI